MTVSYSDRNLTIIEIICRVKNIIFIQSYMAISQLFLYSKLFSSILIKRLLMRKKNENSILQ